MKNSYNGMIFHNLAEKKWVQTINRFLETNLFIAILASLVVICNIFGLEFFIYTLVISYGIYLCLFSRDMRSLAAAVPFMYLSPSVQNNPAANPDSIFKLQNGLGFILAYLMVFVVLLITRIILNEKRGNFVGKRWNLLSSFAFLSVAVLLGGAFQSEWVFSNLLYSALLIVSFVLLYFALILLVDWKTMLRDYFAWAGMCMGFIVVFELVNIYLRGGVIGADGLINTSQIFTGWGVSTNMAGVLICSIPCAFYLSAKKERPWIYIVAATLIYIAAVFTSSRNGVLVGGLIFLASATLALKPQKNRKTQLITYLSIFLFLIASVLVFRKQMVGVFNHLLTAGVIDFQRLEIYKEGFTQFIHAPVFGKGFFACNAFAWGTEKMAVIPPRWHCTVVQMFASCGIVGAAAYGYHRYKTVKLLLRKPTFEKWFIAFSIAALLLSSLVDCFLFNIGPGLFYSTMLAFLEKDEEIPNEEESEKVEETCENTNQNG